MNDYKITWCLLFHLWTEWKLIDEETQIRHCVACDKKEWNEKPNLRAINCDINKHDYGKWILSAGKMFQRRICKSCGYVEKTTIHEI